MNSNFSDGRYRPARPVSKREVWEALKEQDQNGNLEGASQLVRDIGQRFGVQSIELETASEKIRWRNQEG